MKKALLIIGLIALSGYGLFKLTESVLELDDFELKLGGDND